MNEIKKVIVKMLVESDGSDFIFDKNHVKHGDKDRIYSFFKTVKNEIENKLNQCVEGNLFYFIDYR